jgi:hypothetical protein
MMPKSYLRYGDYGDAATYFIIYLQLLCNFLFPLLLSKRNRTEAWRLLRCADANTTSLFKARL